MHITFQLNIKNISMRILYNGGDPAFSTLYYTLDIIQYHT